MIDQVINTKNLKEAEAVILSAPYEGSVSFMDGTAEAPKKIIDCLNDKVELFDIDLKYEPAKKIKTGHLDLSIIKKMTPEKAVNKIAEEYQKLFNKNDKKFVILLGGEHTVSLGAFQAIAKKEKTKDITILQIDAHQDLRDDDSDYSEKPNKYAHSCVMRRAHELGFPIVQIGVRVFSKYEYDFWQKNRNTIKVFPWKKNWALPSVPGILKAIKTKKVYLSIDVDGFDPSCMPGTGTPVQAGLNWNYSMSLIEKLLKEKNVIGADIVEVSPQKDSVLTEYGAAQLCYTILANKFRK